MFRYILLAIMWLGIAAVAAAVTYGPACLVWRHGERLNDKRYGAYSSKTGPWKWGAYVLAAVVTAGWIGVLVWAVDESDPDGVHTWRGGSGPATECHYETREHSVLVGKIVTTEDAVYTVCADQGVAR